MESEVSSQTQALNAKDAELAAARKEVSRYYISLFAEPTSLFTRDSFKMLEKIILEMELPT